MSFRISVETKQKLLTKIRELSQGIPVSWDRVIEAEMTDFELDGCLTDQIFVYGWIQNKKSRDMVSVSCYIIHHIPQDENKPFEDEFFELRFFTSSAKYSEILAKNWKIEKDHNPCIRFFEYFRPEASGDLKL